MFFLFKNVAFVSSVQDKASRRIVSRSKAIFQIDGEKSVERVLTMRVKPKDL